MSQNPFEATYQALAAALKEGHYDQIGLVQAAEAAYALLDIYGDDLPQSDYTSLRILLAQVEREIGLYFGS